VGDAHNDKLKIKPDYDPHYRMCREEYNSRKKESPQPKDL